MTRPRAVTAGQMRRIEEAAVRRYGIPLLLLMEGAGSSCVDEIAKLRIPRTSLVSVLCGPGNNGGDGFVIARHLFSRGYRVQTLYFPSGRKLSGEARTNLEIVKKIKVPLEVNPAAGAVRRNLRESALAVDALFGIGLSKPVEGVLGRVIELVNASKAKVLSVDIPSGMNADTGRAMGNAVRADLTVTFGLPKKGFAFAHSRTFTGRVVVKSISFPPRLLGGA